MPKRPKVPDDDELLRFLGETIRNGDVDTKTRLHVAEFLLKRHDSVQSADAAPPPLVVKVEYVSEEGDPPGENPQAP